MVVPRLGQPMKLLVDSIAFSSDNITLLLCPVAASPANKRRHRHFKQVSDTVATWATPVERAQLVELLQVTFHTEQHYSTET